MKYLKLYEAFSSNTLSKLYKHLKKKNATKTSLNHFKEDLSTIMKSFDIPMDEISDEDVSYLSRRKALGLRNEEKVENESGIWAIKFWFDKDGEYIGTSGTGNETFTVYAMPTNTGKQSKPFGQDQWSYLKSFQKTGILKPILEEDYENLKDGDEVIGVLVAPEDYEEQKIDGLTLGRIFIDDDGDRYIVHDNSEADGVSPDNDPSDIHPNIEWGSYTWKIYGRQIAEDHFNLHQVLKSDSPLKYYSEKKEVENDPFEFNLSLEQHDDDSIKMGSWSGNYEEKVKIEKEGDFAVILYIDDILKRGLKSPKEKGAEREESRKGAVALMTDEEFKRVNLERIMKRVVEKIGVTPESVELKNLQKVVANIVSSGISESYAFLGIITRDYRSIDDFSYQIRRLVSCLSIEGGETMLGFVYNEFANDYRRIKRNSSVAYKNKKIAMDLIKERVELKPLYDAIMGISSKITKSILSKEITRGEDLKKVFFKLGSIESFTRDDEFIFSHKLRDFIEHIRYATSDTKNVKAKVDGLVGNYCDLESEDGKTDLQRDLGKLKEIESYIDDIMK